MLLLKTKRKTTKNQHKENPGQVGRDFFITAIKIYQKCLIKKKE